MKPLLIIPPCPARWPALAELYEGVGPPWHEDLERRFCRGVADSTDAFAVIPDGGRLLSAAYVCKIGAVGVVGRAFTRPEHRRRGHAAAIFKTMTTWFDMMGGRRLFAQAPREVAEALLARAGFRRVRDCMTPAGELATMVRGGDGSDTPNPEGALDVRAATRADWPRIVELLLHKPGPDPRVSLEESSGSAFASTLELLNEQDRGTCVVLAAVSGERVTGLATVATNQPGERTFAMLMPHDEPSDALRSAVQRLAVERGYARVDFPMTALAGGTGHAAEGGPAAPTATSDEGGP